MNKQTIRAIAYAQNALSFVFLDYGINNYVVRMYLYGSAIRGELEDESDIDIFIDCSSENEKIVEGVAKAALSRFYNSKDYEKWKLLKFDYPISIQVGELNSWQLKTSIMSEGILLYSKQAEILPGKREVIFTIELPTNKKRYLHLVRSLFGRKEKGYKEHGFLKDVGGKKLSSTVIIVPKEYLEKTSSFLQKEKVNYSMKEMFVF